MGFNGYRTWSQWNVSLWLNDEEHMQREMIRSLRRYPRDREGAARFFLQRLNDEGIVATPDGAVYSVTGILAAMRGL